MNTIGDYVPSHPPRPILNQEKPWHVTLPVDYRHKDSLPVVVIWKFLKFIQYYTVQPLTKEFYYNMSVLFAVCTFHITCY